jgi:hypothetical protein
MKRLLLGFALLVASWTAPADDIALYKVELIVFENLDPGAIQAEQWPESPGTPPLDNAVELSAVTAAPPPPINNTMDTAAAAPLAADTDAAPAAATAPSPPTPSWQWLDDSELSLNAQVKRLNDSQRYKTIVHVGWIQPLDDSDEGTPVHIYDGMELQHTDAADQAAVAITPLGQDDADAQTVTPDAVTGTPPMPEEDNPSQTQPPASAGEENAMQPSAEETPHVLDGTFTLRRGRFLHVDVDLGFTKTVAVAAPATDDDTLPAPPPETASYYVRMTQSRRIRNGELHYLDHPLFGVLFTVSPYQPEGMEIPTK